MSNCAAGICPLIKHCRSLRSLSLLRCSGPFSDALSASLGARRPLLKLQKLRIVGGMTDISCAGLSAMLDR